MKSPSILIVAVLHVMAAGSSFACDVCGCYSPRLETSCPSLVSASKVIAPDEWAGNGLYSAIGEQFTHFATVQFNGREIDNPTGQREESSITQLVAGYNFDERFGLQVNVPMIYRYYKRPEGFDIQRGSVSGLGDVSLLGRFVLFQKGAADSDFSVSASVFAGLKFPTGDSSRIKEEFHEVEVEGAPESGIHGHDLTLGTGSYDGVFGGRFSLRYKSVFFEAETQFTLHGEGRHSYQFADELSWSGGPGCYLVRRDAALIGLQFVLSGETKGTDIFQGQAAEDTGVTSLYLGPRLLAAVGRFSGEIGADLPAIMNNTKLQVVPDYRIRAGFSVRF